MPFAPTQTGLRTAFTLYEQCTQRYPASPYEFTVSPPQTTLGIFHNEERAKEALKEHKSRITCFQNDYSVCMLRKSSERACTVVLVPKEGDMITEMKLWVEEWKEEAKEMSEQDTVRDVETSGCMGEQWGDPGSGFRNAGVGVEEDCWRTPTEAEAAGRLTYVVPEQTRLPDLAVIDGAGMETMLGRVRAWSVDGGPGTRRFRKGQWIR